MTGAPDTDIAVVNDGTVGWHDRAAAARRLGERDGDDALEALLLAATDQTVTPDAAVAVGDALASIIWRRQIPMEDVEFAWFATSVYNAMEDALEATVKAAERTD